MTALPARPNAAADAPGLRRTLLGLCALKVAVLVLAFDPAGFVPFDLPKSLLGRALEWLIGSLLVVAFLRHGRAILPQTRLNLVVAVVCGAYVIAAAFAVNQYVALFGDQERYVGVTFLVDMLILYAGCAIAVRNAREGSVLIGAIFVSGAVAVAYAIVQALGLDPFTWAADPRARPFSTFGSADQLGHFLSVLFGVTLGVAVGARNRPARVAAIALLAGSVIAAGVVATRGTLVGVGGVLAALAAVRRPTRAVALAAVAAVLAVVVLLAPSPLGVRVRATLGGAELTDRALLYESALRAIASRPILGYGPDNFRTAYAEHRPPSRVALSGAGPETSAHDWLLEVAATTGIVGLAAALVLLVIGTVELLRVARAQPGIGAPLFFGWVAYWMNALVDVQSVALDWFPWLALGIAAGLRGPRHAASGRRIPGWLVAALLIAACAGATTSARAFIANRDAWSAVLASYFGDTASALTFADRAAARDGGRADNWNRLGLALEDQKRWSPAADAYREATRREPHEVVYWANLARSLARVALAGDASARDGAIAAATQATVIDPNAPVGHVVLAEIALAFGRCDLARTEAARAAALRPGEDEIVTRASSCH